MPESAERVAKPKGKIYKTSDQLMCEVLLMAGYEAVSVIPDDDGQLTYSFSIEEVWPVIEGILTGKADTLQFTYANWWKARVTWQMNLRHMSSMRNKRRH